MPNSNAFVTVQEAVRLIVTPRPELGVENIPLEEALGRRLAGDVSAKVTMPPFDASAMDGYAVSFDDAISKGDRLRVIGEVPAGALNPFTIKAGETVRVFTGSPMPKRSNHVLIQEHATVEQDHILVSTEQSIARHIRKAGGDFCKGDIVLKAGDMIGPSQIGLAAAANHNQLPLFRRLGVAILTTGSELQSPGGALEPDQTVDSNFYAIGSLSEALGADVERLGIAADSQTGIEAKFEEASAADIIVTIGGASVAPFCLDTLIEIPNAAP